ncbi:MAG: hypothetical protein KKC46_14030 [Proteobacteria bacterium]|nr:hypothetical protein [Pseudomonadota bacterium]
MVYSEIPKYKNHAVYQAEKIYRPLLRFSREVIIGLPISAFMAFCLDDLPKTNEVQTFSYTVEPLSKRFSLVKLKAGENFNHWNTLSISRIEI